MLTAAFSKQLSSRSELSHVLATMDWQMLSRERAAVKEKSPSPHVRTLAFDKYDGMLTADGYNTDVVEVAVDICTSGEGDVSVAAIWSCLAKCQNLGTRNFDP